MRIHFSLLVLASFPSPRRCGECPVSSTLEAATTNWYNANQPKRKKKTLVPLALLPYPMDVFEPRGMTKLVLYNRSSLTWCRASDAGEETMIPSAKKRATTNRLHACSITTPCPVSPASVSTANKATWEVRTTSFCAIRERLSHNDGSSNAPLNIIVFGGSVTLGVGSTGCCCSRVHDARCPYAPGEHPNCEHVPRTARAPTTGPRPVSLCTWHGYLERWLAVTFPAAAVRVVSLAQGGLSSDLVGDEGSPYELSAALRAKGIASLTSTDLIFIDFSVNDGRSFTSERQLAGGLDRFLQRLFRMGVNGSWPTAVLLEQWPYAGRAFTTATTVAGAADASPDYSRTYQLVARRFGLPLWSYRDVAWAAQTQGRPFADYLLFRRNLPLQPKGGTPRPEGKEGTGEGDPDPHPPWYIHLFVADLVASLLLREFDRCADGTVSDMPATKMHPARLPPPLLNASLSWRCRADDPHVAGFSIVSAAAASGPLSPIVLGSLTSSPPPGPRGGWRLFEDRPGKPGWISQDPHSSTSPPSLSWRDYPTLTLRSVQPYVHVHAHAPRSSHPLLLTIVYLRTYTNAGVVEVSLCGHPVLTIDALWPDWRSRKISIPQSARIVVDAGQAGCVPGQPVEVNITRVPAPPPVSEAARYPRQPLPRRSFQKVKIISVDVCRA